MTADPNYLQPGSSSAKRSTLATAHESTVRPTQPSDPRLRLHACAVPCGRAGCPVRGEQDDTALGTLACVTGAHTASNVSSQRTVGVATSGTCLQIGRFPLRG